MQLKLAAPALFGLFLALSAAAHGEGVDIAALANSALAVPSPSGALVSTDAFEASFDQLGVTYTPILGPSAPRTESLRIVARSIGRGGPADLILAPASPTVEGDQVRYARGSGVTEVYAVGAEGIAQSFVLAAPPAGGGELIVRCDLFGTLAPLAVATDDGGLDFSGPSGGARMGGVTGVDADGRTCPGELRAADGHLDLVLPADFVATATYPLVVDPLIGSVFGINNETWDDGDPDLAYDATTDTYLVVWRRAFSASDVRIRGQRVGSAGNLIGPVVFFGQDAGGTGSATGAPHVANVTWSDRFLVVWSRDGVFGEDLVAQACLAADGSLSSTVTLLVSFSADGIGEFDVAGEAQNKAKYTDALVTWHRKSSSAGIYTRPVSVPPTGNPVGGATVQITDNDVFFTNMDSPSIAATGGAIGVVLLAYRSFSFIDGDWEVRAVALDRAGQPTTSSVGLTFNSVDELAPRADGGATLGPQFVVAYEREANPTLRELEISSLAIQGGQLVVTGSSVVTQSLTALSDYELAWTPGRATLVWSVKSLFQNTWTVLTQDFSATDAKPCGASATVTAYTPPSGGVELGIASVASGGVPGQGEGLIVFSYDTVTAGGNVGGRRFDSLSGGSLTDLGGACGAGGTIVPSGNPTIGNGYFQLTLVGAEPTSPATVLNLTAPATPFFCDACAWLPFQATTVYPTLNGASQVVLQVPCEASLVGQPFEAQFTTPTPGSTPCALAPQFSVSNRLQIVLGS
ncbi:hypothetical protein [Engelhardtia mirabilis]|uniref:Uncharacterized protein n=1 Tax=Engelhardtia mirabilis TaxID=2528011 RepID=A0A518BGC7_9BACT|nr:hypothetical protein Pla133_11030 [Planctomycetes bacterium Pla133]QDV00364.1 hypothetical protein Pla86_11030 [Planctomycetes bacterium Pla86]